MQMPVNDNGIIFDLKIAAKRWITGTTVVGAIGGYGHSLILHTDMKASIGYALVGFAAAAGWDWSKFKKADGS